MDIRTVQYPISVTLREENVTGLLDALQNLPAGSAANCLRRKQASALALASFNMLASFLEPVAAKICEPRNAPFINAPQFLLVSASQFFPEPTALQERWTELG